MRIILSFPLLALTLVVYNVFVFGSGRNLSDLFAQFTLPNGALVSITNGQAMIIASLALLFIEVVKAARVGNATIVDHFLSTAVFIIALVEFLLVPEAGTSTFLIFVIICLIDVAAGFAISIRTARRDLSIGGEGGAF